MKLIFTREFLKSLKGIWKTFSAFFPTGAVVVVVLIVVSDFHTLFMEIRTIKLHCKMTVVAYITSRRPRLFASPGLMYNQNNSSSLPQSPAHCSRIQRWISRVPLLIDRVEGSEASHRSVPVKVGCLRGLDKKKGKKERKKYRHMRRQEGRNHTCSIAILYRLYLAQEKIVAKVKTLKFTQTLNPNKN